MADVTTSLRLRIIARAPAWAVIEYRRYLIDKRGGVYRGSDPFRKLSRGLCRDHAHAYNSKAVLPMHIMCSYCMVDVII